MGKKETPKKEKSSSSSPLKASSSSSSEQEQDLSLIQGGSISPIARPLADSKFSKKLFKTVKKATKAKEVRRGVKEVVKSMRKGQKGLVLLAGDVSPMDVLSHVPLLCEESAIPYIFVPSKVALGLASSTKRPTSCLMLCPKPTSDYTKYYEEVLQETKAALLVAV